MKTKWLALVAVLAMAFVAGCETVGTSWGTRCAWCGKASHTCEEYGWPVMSERTYRARVKPHLIKDDEGYVFCTLRCRNAYLASKGIQEKRSRVIQQVIQGE